MEVCIQCKKVYYGTRRSYIRCVNVYIVCMIDYEGGWRCIKVWMNVDEGCMKGSRGSIKLMLGAATGTVK